MPSTAAAAVSLPDELTLSRRSSKQTNSQESTSTFVSLEHQAMTGHSTHEVRKIWLRNLTQRHPLVTSPNPDTPFPVSNNHEHTRCPRPKKTKRREDDKPRVQTSPSSGLPSLRHPESTIDTKIHQSLKRVQNITIKRRGNPPPALSINPFYATAHPLSNQLLREMLSPMSPMSPHSPLSPLSNSHFSFFPLHGGNPYLRPQPLPQQSTQHMTSTTTSTTSHRHHSRSQVRHGFNGPATTMG